MAGGSVWVALEAGADPVTSARALRGAHGRFFTGDAAHEPPGGVRSVIAASWRRSTRAGVAPDAPAAAPVVLDESAVADHRERSGLAAALPLVSDLVGLRTREARHVLIVTDVLGHLLWVEGDRELRRRIPMTSANSAISRKSGRIGPSASMVPELPGPPASHTTGAPGRGAAVRIRRKASSIEGPDGRA